MAQIKGGLFAKGGSGTIIANNGAYFVDLTNATESSGTYTIPSADIENGDFTLQVGDTLIDKDSGSMLKVATLTPDITATLVYEASSGGSQLYQHNIKINQSPSNATHLGAVIISDRATAYDYNSLKDYLTNNSMTSSGYCLPASGFQNGSLIILFGLWYNSTAGSIQTLAINHNTSSPDAANRSYTSNNMVIHDTVVAL